MYLYINFYYRFMIIKNTINRFCHTFRNKINLLTFFNFFGWEVNFI